MKKQDWEFVNESTEFERLMPGGYVAVITDVEDMETREYLNITYDIAEGPRKGYYSDQWGVDHPYAHRFVRSYKDTAMPMFKAFLKRLEESNESFTIAGWQETSDERAFIGLEIGVVLREFEKLNNFGEVKTYLEVGKVVSADTIRRGDFNQLPKKTLAQTERADVYTDVPF